MIIPNIITCFRIVLVPVFIIFLLERNLTYGFIVFTVAGISDGIDGFVARIFNMRSDLGAYLDPLADKLLLISAFIMLAVLKLIPPWLTVIAISRDILIMIGVLSLIINRSRFAIKPLISSKITTFLQIVTVGMVLIRDIFPYLRSIEYPLFIASAGLAILSGLLYIKFWFETVGEISMGTGNIDN